MFLKRDTNQIQHYEKELLILSMILIKNNNIFDALDSYSVYKSIYFKY